MKKICRKIIICLSLFLLMFATYAPYVKIMAQGVAEGDFKIADTTNDMYKDIDEIIPESSATRTTYFADMSDKEISSELQSMEVTSLRSEYIKVFEYEGEGVVYISATPLHTYNETTKEYEDINSNLKADSKISGSYKPTNVSSNINVVTNIDETFEIDDIKIDLNTTGFSSGEVVGNKIYFSNESDYIDIIVEIDNDTLSFQVVFYKLPTTNFDFSIDVAMPSGYSVVDNGSYIQILNTSGEEVFHLNTPSVYDSEHNSIPIKYTITQTSTGFNISYDFSNLTTLDASTIFPITMYQEFTSKADSYQSSINTNTVAEGYPEGVEAGGGNVIYTGYDQGGTTGVDEAHIYQQTRTYMAFNIKPYEDLEYQYVDVTNATLNMYQHVTNNTSDKMQLVMITDTGVTAEETQTYSWNSQPSDIDVNHDTQSDTMTRTSMGTVQFNITNYVAYLTGEDENAPGVNRGFILKMEDERSSESDTSYSEAAHFVSQHVMVVLV